ncbi:MAG: hypothetical protein AAGJ73_02730 [Pseudomonadota bacterium]
MIKWGYLVVAMSETVQKSPTREDRVGGYLTSALVFSAITALWAWIVRDDPYYAMTQLLGLTLPVATVVYLTVMPGLGFIAGRWRYQADGARGAGAWVAKVFARSLHFLYAHILIVLFTLAMAVDHFLGWNLDQAVQDIDDGMFDIAARFSPWVSAYLAGFNLGRVWAAGEAHVKPALALAETTSDFSETDAAGEVQSYDDRHDRVTIEAFTPTPREPDLDPKTNRPRFSRLR